MSNRSRQIMKRGGLALAGLAIVVLAFPPSAHAAWYNASWGYRKKITIQETQIPGTSVLTNFPVLVNRTDADWKWTGDGGKVGKSDGTDILFTSSDGTTKLDHELEKYGTATGEVVAWVRIPSLSSTANTEIYIYYGNAGAVDQQNKTGVWETNYKGVWHLKETSGTTITDSTSTAANAAKVSATEPNPAAAKIGDGQAFDGTNDYLNVGVGGTDPSITGSRTLSAWVKPNAVTGLGNPVVTGGPGGAGDFWGIGGTTGSCDFVGQNQLYVDHWGTACYDSNNAVTAGSWNYVALVWDSAGQNLYFYVNGVAGTTVSGSLYTYNLSTHDLGGNNIAGSTTRAAYTGDMDEVRVALAIRSGDWITSEYNNQNSPSTFYAVGGEETQAGTAPACGYSNRSARKPVTINNTGNASTLTNYQTKVSVTYDSDMQADFDDVCFTSFTGTALDYWRETYTASSSATFWAEVPSVAASANTTIYMYYGGAPFVSTSSSLENTFKNNTIYLETRRCTDATNCGYTDNHTEFDNIVNAGYTLDGSGDRTAADDATNPFGTADNYFSRYRFLFKADTTDTHGFGVNTDDAGEAHQRDAGDTDTGHTVRASWYGAHGSGTCGSSGTLGSLALTNEQVIWLELRQTEWGGGQGAQMCIRETTGGSYQIVNTTNFPSQLFARIITSPEPTVSAGSEEIQTPGGFGWTDNPLTAGSALVRKVHVDELRTQTNNKRTNFGLAATGWTDATITAGTTLIRKVHLDELRTAINDVRTGFNNDCPAIVPAAASWTDSTVTAGTTLIRATHITELRSAVDGTGSARTCCGICGKGDGANCANQLSTEDLWNDCDTGLCKSGNCAGSANACGYPADDAGCGASITCTGWYVKSTKDCYNKTNITTNRCEAAGDCKDANSSDCNATANNALQYSCATCKKYDTGACTGTTLGACATNQTSSEDLWNECAGTPDPNCSSIGNCNGSGACTVGCYADSDGDGYGTGAVVQCGPCGAGQATNNTDCCDSDANAKPGQTLWYGTPRTTCGGYDYNCSGIEEQELRGTYSPPNTYFDNSSCTGANFRRVVNDSSTCGAGTYAEDGPCTAWSWGQFWDTSCACCDRGFTDYCTTWGAQQQVKCH